MIQNFVTTAKVTKGKKEACQESCTLMEKKFHDFSITIS